MANRSDVAAAIKFFKIEFKGSQPKAPDHLVASRLTAIAKEHNLPCSFSPRRIVDLRTSTKEATDEEVSTINLLIETHRPGLDVTTVRKALKPASAATLFFPSASPERNEPITPLLARLAGFWRLFYVAPFDRQGKPAIHIRGLLAYLGAIPGSETEMEVVMVSSHTDWAGTCFVNDNHLYAIIDDLNKASESAFLITNRPSKGHNFIAGLLMALDRNTDSNFRTAGACLCFGERLSKTGESTGVPAPISSVLQNIYERQKLTGNDLGQLRNHFCKPYDDFRSFSNDHPDLFQHLSDHISINGEPFGHVSNIFLKWVS